MSFGVDYSKAGAGLIPEGKYEAIIKEAYLSQSRNDTPCISMPMVIRNDIEQPCQNRVIYHSLWKRKEPTQEDAAVDGYSFKQIQGISKAAGLQNGKKYASLDEWADDLHHRCVNVEVTHEEFNKRMNARAAWINAPEINTVCKHVFKSEDTDTAALPPADEDDELPFN